MAYFEVNKKPPLSFPTLTGSIVSFNSQYAGLPLKSHVVEVVASQSGTGTPSPSNPRPITGYSAINISHSDTDTSNPTVYTITIGSTVYGGEYDARTGVLTVTHKGIIYDGSSDENWYRYTSGSASTFAMYSNNALGSNINSIPKSSYLQGLSRLETWGNYDNWVGILGGDRLATGIQSITDVEVWKTYLSNNPLTVVYELATPITIQLPPCPIDTLQGVNNIWADTGDTTLQYPKFG